MSHVIELRYSRDGGENYTLWQPRESGETGRFLTPLIWRRLGLVQEERIWEIRDTSNVPAEILDCMIDAEGE